MSLMPMGLSGLPILPGAKPGVYFGRVVSQVSGRAARVASTTPALKLSFPHLAVLPAEMNGVIAVVVPAK